MNCNNNIKINPGIPRNPTVNAVIGLMATTTPIKPPTKFNIHNAIPPMIPFSKKRNNSFRGTSSNHPTKYKTTRPNP